MSMLEMTAVISRFQAATDALAALGARLGMGEGDTVAPEILAALDEVLAAAGVAGVDGLEPQQRAMMAGLIRTMFAQSADLLGCPTRDAGWSYTDPVLLEGVGRATLPGGQVVMAHYEPPPDPLPRTTMRLRTIRDGGSVLDADGAAELLRNAGCQDVHSLTRTWPIPFGFVTGQKA